MGTTPSPNESQGQSSRAEPRETVRYLLEALLEAGVPALVVLTTLLYAPYFTDYMIPKTGAVFGMVGLLLGIWLAHIAVCGRLRLERSPFYLPLLIYLTVALVTLFFAHNVKQGGEVLLLQLWLLAFYVLVINNFRDPTAASGVLWTIVLVGLVVASLGLLQYNGIHLIPQPEAVGDMPLSTLGNPNFVAHYLEVVILLTVGLLPVRRRLWERFLLAVTLVVTCSHMVLTQSRGGWLATAVGLLVLFLARRKRFRWGTSPVLAIVVVALLSPAVELVLNNVYWGQDSLNDRFGRIAKNSIDRALSSFERRDFSISQRRIVWADTFELIEEHFWLGVGPGNYELFLPAHRSVTRHRAWKELMGGRTQVAFRAHNEYLEVLAESGIFGLAALLWLLGTMLWVGYRFLKTQADDDSTSRAITSSCLAGLVATLVHSLFSFNLQDPTSAAHFWLLGGLLVAVNKGREDKEEEPPGDGFFCDIRLGRLLRLSAGLGAAAVVLVGGYVGLSVLMGDYYYFRGLQQNGIGHPNRASLEFRRAVDWRAYDFRYHQMLGLVDLRAGRYAQAEQALVRSTALHPNNAPALRLLGRALYWNGRGELAVTPLQRAAWLDPLELDSYEWLARAYRKRGDHHQAIETWKQALAFKPEDLRLLKSLGVEYAKAEQFETAVGVLEQAERLHPQDGEIQGNLGNVYLGLGRVEKAEQALLRAVELQPQQVNWRLGLAQLYLALQKGEAAARQLEAVFELDPDNPIARQLRGMVHRQIQEGMQ